MTSHSAVNHGSPVDDAATEAGVASEQPSLTRRVVTGVSGDGRSLIVSDGETPTWVRRPTGVVVMDVWRADSVPTHVADEPTEGGELVLAPPAAGVCARIAVFPPDRDIDADSAAAYAAAMQDIYGEQEQGAPGEAAGMHSTETVDIVTVVDGEIWLVMENGETLLKAGDCLVQRGTRHAWSNRSDRPCTLATTMLPAVRS